MDMLVQVQDLSKIYNPGENEVRALDPVSYTHLDVYKRQSEPSISPPSPPQHSPAIDRIPITMEAVAIPLGRGCW